MRQVAASLLIPQNKTCNSHYNKRGGESNGDSINNEAKDDNITFHHLPSSSWSSGE